MHSIDWYCNEARSRHRLKSDLALARRLGLGTSAISYWRTGRTWPADETMIRLAELAGCDAGEALLDLNRWRAPEPVKPVYAALSERLTAGPVQPMSTTIPS